MTDAYQHIAYDLIVLVLTLLFVVWTTHRQHRILGSAVKRLARSEVPSEALLHQHDDPPKLFDLPGLIVIGVFRRIGWIDQDRHGVLSWNGFIHLATYLLFLFSVALSLPFALIAATQTTRCLLEASRFTYLREIWDCYVEVPLLLFEILLALQFGLAVLLLIVAVCSTNRRIYSHNHARRLKRRLSEMKEQRWRGNWFGKLIRTFGYFLALAASATLATALPYLAVEFLVPLVRDPEIGPLQKSWGIHFLWPPVFIGIGVGMGVAMMITVICMGGLFSILVHHTRRLLASLGVRDKSHQPPE